jgi:hypothetical protein
MWHARLPRRDFIELCLGASKPVKAKLPRTDRVLVDDDGADFHVYWQHEAEVGYQLPNLVVSPDDESSTFLKVVIASPQAPSPLTALCRILTRNEAEAYFASDAFHSSHDVLPVMAALAMAEAVLHAEGRIGLRQITPAVCKRTLSYAWGRSLAMQIPFQSMERLPGRWIETYELVNSQSGLEPMRRTIDAAVGALVTVAELSKGARPEAAAVAMAHAIMAGDSHAKDAAWRDLARFLEDSISLDALSASTREERGSYLQQALRISHSNLGADRSVDAACAFIATQVAPGSLEHLDILRERAAPSVLMWYALYAALQSPNEVLSGQNGLGFRVLRDIARAEDRSSRPTADIAFAELKALERVGIDSVARKLGHAAELEVELVPFVTSSFTYHSKANKSRIENFNQQQLAFEPDQSVVPDSSVPTKARIARLLSSLEILVQELPDTSGETTTGAARKSRRNK